MSGRFDVIVVGTGGVGSAAVQLGVAAGARVIATAGSPAKLEFCRNLGAHHAVDYNDPDELYRQVMAITGGHGVDVAFDPVGGTAGDVTRRLMAWEGRLVVIGFAAGTSSITMQGTRTPPTFVWARWWKRAMPGWSRRESVSASYSKRRTSPGVATWGRITLTATTNGSLAWRPS